MGSTLFPRLPTVKRTLLSDIARCADDLGISAYLVGGVVRDLLLRRPAGDIDIVTDGSAVALAQAWARRMKAKCVAYERFGTATVYLSKDEAVDFVTARSETYPHPGELPVVVKGDIRDDLYRRDFSVNAMALALKGEKDQLLVDPFGGEKDIKSGLIRVMHEKSFVDDPTRVLRAVRFEQRLGFRIEASTLRCLKRAVSSGAMDTLKPERIFAEFKKNLQEDTAALNLKRLDGLRALGWLNAAWTWSDAEAGTLASLEASRQWCRRWTLPIPPRWLLAWMLLFKDASMDQAMEMSRKFGIGSANLRSLKQAKSYRSCLEKLSAANLAPSDVCRILEGMSIPALVFIRASAVSQRQRRYISQYMREWMNVVIPVTGDDLTRVGVAPGPQFKSCLERLKNMYMDGTATTRSQLLRQAQLFARAEQ